MIYKLRAIVLNTIKYSDTSIIAKLYTDGFGLQTYMINGARTAKTRSRAMPFQPLFLLELEAYKREKSEIQHLKEYKLAPPLQSIPFDVRKSSIAIFIAEVLYKVIREEEKNERLFNFIYNSVLLFDQMPAGIANFHLHFLANLSQYLGFYPDSETGATQTFFDIKNGTFTAVQPTHLLYFDAENSAILLKMLQTPASKISEIELNRRQRDSFLEAMLSFFTYHFNSLSPIKSLKVFKEIFND